MAILFSPVLPIHFHCSSVFLLCPLLCALVLFLSEFECPLTGRVMASHNRSTKLHKSPTKLAKFAKPAQPPGGGRILAGSLVGRFLMPSVSGVNTCPPTFPRHELATAPIHPTSVHVLRSRLVREKRSSAPHGWIPVERVSMVACERASPGCRRKVGCVAWA